MIQVHRNIEHLPSFSKAVITIGTFDGVHQGHQQIIKLLKEEAEAVNGETVIITFHPHPRKILAGGKSEVKIIYTLEEKIELLDKQGIQHVVVVEFNNDFANQTAEEYVENFLVKKFHPHTIIIGYDHKFGKNRSGNYQLLEKLGETFNYRVREIPEQILNNVIISSTKIREALLHSSIDTANMYLGHPYFFSGKVIEGNKLGRTIGYPTANLHIEDPEKIVPKNGVYAVSVTIADSKQIFNGMMNIGNRPTINGTSRTVEVHIFDFDQTIYGEKMKVYVKHYLRSEKKFDGLDKLKEQLAIDKLQATDFLEK